MFLWLLLLLLWKNTPRIYFCTITIMIIIIILIIIMIIIITIIIYIYQAMHLNPHPHRHEKPKNNFTNTWRLCNVSWGKAKKKKTNTKQNKKKENKLKKTKQKKRTETKKPKRCKIIHYHILTRCICNSCHLLVYILHRYIRYTILYSTKLHFLLAFVVPSSPPYSPSSPVSTFISMTLNLNVLPFSERGF